MKFYSDYPSRRTRQIVTDLVALAAIAAWAWLGATVYALVMALADFGVQMQDAGAGFRETMTDISGQLSGVPIIGGGIRGPFDGASDAGAVLEDAGIAQQAAVHQLATVLGVGIAVLPSLMILVVWLVPRLRFARRAGTARRLVDEPASLDLLALRALTGRKVSRIAAIDPDAAAAWRRADPEVIAALARLELKASGVRLPSLDAG
jgi:hypothetical protein